jgi:hypothetical protein
MVAMFLSSKFSSNFLGKSVINVSNADWLQYGDNAYDWFGSHVNFFVDKNYVSFIFFEFDLLNDRSTFSMFDTCQCNLS